MIPRELFQKIRQIEIRTRGLVNHTLGGEYHSAFRGRGIEFSEVRPYQFGDEIRSIDWNVSARAGETYVKIFEEEREQTVLLAVDVSASGDFGTTRRFKREVAAEICALLAFSAIQNNDRVGLLLFSDQIELFVPPRKGRKHVLRIIRELFALDPRSQGTAIGGALEHILRMMKQRSIVVLVSDFFDEGYERSLAVLSRRHDVVALELSDPREREIPPVGLVRVEDAETGASMLVDFASAAVRNAVAATSAARRRRTANLMTRLDVSHAVIDTAEDYVEPLVHLFRHRNRPRR
jgi:uncharacterized protein (DUF58 family)